MLPYAVVSTYPACDLSQFVVEVRVAQSEKIVVVAVIPKPMASRLERTAALLAVKERFMQEQKEVFVTADLDIYCKLNREDCDLGAVLAELYRRGSYV